MNWSRRHAQPPGLRHLPEDDQPPRPAPLLAQPWAAGMTGWAVVFCAVIVELAGGAVVANQTSTAVAVAVLITPVVVVFGFAVVQWWQVTRSGAERAPWWHLAGVAAAIFTWVVWPTVPGPLIGTTAVTSTSNARAFCFVLPGAAVSDCLRRTAQAFDLHNLVWWPTGALILIARCSRAGRGSRPGERSPPRWPAASSLPGSSTRSSCTTTSSERRAEAAADSGQESRSSLRMFSEVIW